jgi:2-hydroxychromene-2-carboxylate isomerase
MSPPDAAFYFDLASPLAYLAAEQILQALPASAQWQPVLARALGAGNPRPAPAHRAEWEISGPEIERQARELGLQELRWPSQYPFDSEPAMRVATYAKSIGRTVPFAQAAFRQAFAGGHSLEDFDFVLLAAAACEMHPRAVLQSVERASVREELAANTAVAASAGVTGVPAIRVGTRVFQGSGALPDATAHIADSEQ